MKLSVVAASPSSNCRCFIPCHHYGRVGLRQWCPTGYQVHVVGAGHSKMHGAHVSAVGETCDCRYADAGVDDQCQCPPAQRRWTLQQRSTKVDGVMLSAESVFGKLPVQNCGQIRPTFSRGNECDIAQSGLVGRPAVEASLQHVRRHRQTVIGIGCYPVGPLVDRA